MIFYELILPFIDNPKPPHQANHACCQAADQAEPVAEGAHIGVGGEKPAHRQTGDPVGKQGEQEGDSYIFIAPQDPLNRSGDGIDQKEKFGVNEKFKGKIFDNRVTGIEGGDLFVVNQQIGEEKKSDDYCDADAEIAVMSGIQVAASTIFVAYQNCQRHRDAERHHIKKPGEIHCGLVRCGNSSAVATHQEGDDTKDADLTEDGKTNRQTDGKLLFKGGDAGLRP